MTPSAATYEAAFGDLRVTERVDGFEMRRPSEWRRDHDAGKDDGRDQRQGGGSGGECECDVEVHDRTMVVPGSSRKEVTRTNTSANLQYENCIGGLKSSECGRALVVGQRAPGLPMPTTIREIARMPGLGRTAVRRPWDDNEFLALG